MQVNVIPARSIDASLARAWTELQFSNSELASPYFAPEFTQAIAAVRDDVEVAVIEEGGKLMALFPFQRDRRSVAFPVAGLLSDYQGLICRPGFACDPRELVRKCRLVAWDFDHLLATQECFAPFHQYCEPSPVMDLSKGYEVWAAQCNAVAAVQYQLRRIEKEIGLLRFVPHAVDLIALHETLERKRQQYLASGVRDVFSLGWTRAVVEQIQKAQTENFAGMLSLLYAGDQLVASHFGMRSRTVWHWWFPSYNPAMAKYSPGLILLLKVAEHACSLNMQMIDLGKGMSIYKKRLMNASISVASGSVVLPSWLAFRRGARRRIRALVLNSALAVSASRVIKSLRRQRTPAMPRM